VASAADLPARTYPAAKAPAYVAAVYDWSGFYVGAHVGGAWDSDSFAFSPAKTHTTNKASSAFGGGQVGYNFQISSFVWGVEGDASGAGLSGSSPCPNPFFTCGHKIDFLASLRARLVLRLPIAFCSMGPAARPLPTSNTPRCPPAWRLLSSRGIIRRLKWDGRRAADLNMR
jgi:hypothetical protein